MRHVTAPIGGLRFTSQPGILDGEVAHATGPMVEFNLNHLILAKSLISLGKASGNLPHAPDSSVLSVHREVLP